MEPVKDSNFSSEVFSKSDSTLIVTRIINRFSTLSPLPFGRAETKAKKVK